MENTEKTLEAFLADWPEDEFSRKAFDQLRSLVDGLENVTTEFNARPGVSYSLRPRRAGQEEPLFALVDVIDDPDGKWMSVCFYADTITDPDEEGDFVPEGLNSQDAACFDYDEDDPARLAYIGARLKEAWSKAR